MGAELIDKILPAVERIEWQGKEEITELGSKSYRIALEQVDAYRGDPKAFRQALQTLNGGDSLPLMFAGVAYVLIAASREKDGSYAPAGLQAAFEWLEKAQEIEPDLVGINFIEALIYIHAGQPDNARLVLDYLHNQDPHHYHLMLTEALYQEAQGDVEQMVRWYEVAMEEAATVPQRLRLRSRIGDAYLEAGKLDEALEEYKQALHFDRENASLWHKMSVIYWRQENYAEAQRCNQHVLALKPIPAAQKMAEALKKKLDQDGGMLGKLFGR